SLHQLDNASEIISLVTVLYAYMVILQELTLLFLSTRRTPRSTLFPYTTLFRSWTSISRKTTPRPGFSNYAGKRERPNTSPALRRSEEHTSELQSHLNLVCRLLLEKKNKTLTN